jgi:hypothetical protein
MVRLKLLKNAVKRLTATARLLRRAASSRREAVARDSKNLISEQISVSTSSTGPSLADVEKEPSLDKVRRDGTLLIKTDPSTTLPASPVSSQRSTSVLVESVVAEEITQSPSEAGAEVLLSLKRTKRADGFRRIATLLLLKSRSSATPTQGEHYGANSEGELIPTDRILSDIIAQETGIVPNDDASIETGPSPSRTAVQAPGSLDIDGTDVRPGLRSDDAQNLLETVTLADSLTSDEDDSVVSDPFSKLSDSPKDPHIVAVGSSGTSAQGEVEDGEQATVLSTAGGVVPELSEAKNEIKSPEDQAKEDAKPGHVSFLSEFRKRHQRRSLPTVEEDKDLVGSEIKCITSHDEGESLQRNSSIFSTASSILMDDRSDRVLRARNTRNHSGTCADTCDCFGTGHCEDRSVEFSNGSSIMSDESDYEYSEASVPTCYICLQASEARGSLWQDLR